MNYNLHIYHFLFRKCRTYQLIQKMIQRGMTSRRTLLFQNHSASSPFL